jgi:hypothetical protein
METCHMKITKPLENQQTCEKAEGSPPVKRKRSRMKYQM